MINDYRLRASETVSALLRLKNPLGAEAVHVIETALRQIAYDQTFRLKNAGVDLSKVSAAEIADIEEQLPDEYVGCDLSAEEREVGQWLFRLARILGNAKNETTTLAFLRGLALTLVGAIYQSVEDTELRGQILVGAVNESLVLYEKLEERKHANLPQA